MDMTVRYGNMVHVKRMEGPSPERPPGEEGPLVSEAVAELDAFIRRQRRRIAATQGRSTMSMTHLHVLMVLDAEGPVPMSRVAETLLCSFPNATGIVDRMEERGYVERRRDERDRRLVLVRVTPEGRAALGRLETMRQQHLRGLLRAMSADEQRTCRDAFRLLRQAAERLDDTES
jgi:DNA-binding MarR family transcriptional regulator